MELEDRKNVFHASDWFDLNFLGGFVHSDISAKKQFNEQTYKLGDERLSSRLLNHWYEAGIITDDRPNGKGWKKFSFSEIAWIEIVYKLRSFGLDLKRIKVVKDQIDFYNSLDKISKCPLLDFFMFVSIQSSTPVKLIVFESGQAELVRQIDIDIANSLRFITEDFISIDINRLMDKLLTKKNVKADYLNYSKTPIEKEVYNSVYLNNVKSITIKTNKNDEFLMDKEFVLDSKKEMEILFNKLYYAESTTLAKGKTKVYKLTKKDKIKKW